MLGKGSCVFTVNTAQVSLIKEVLLETCWLLVVGRDCSLPRFATRCSPRTVKVCSSSKKVLVPLSPVTHCLPKTVIVLIFDFKELISVNFCKHLPATVKSQGVASQEFVVSAVHRMFLNATIGHCFHAVFGCERPSKKPIFGRF